MTTLRQTPRVDTTNCDKEPIHVPDTIQNHGVLLASTEGDWTITHVSANAARILRKKPERLLRTSLLELVGTANIEFLTGAQQRARDGVSAIGRVLGARIKGVKGTFNLAIHTYMGQRIVEIEPTDDGLAVPPLDLVSAILARLKEARTIIELCADIAHEVRQLIGYDRVVVYRFLEDGSGQVIAECRNAELETLMGLRYPASDIPRQARDLYKKSWIRLIADVAVEPAPLLQDQGAATAQLDLSYADLRSVSPIHIQYLKNMGVGASMSISIIVGGELWGLIACHHRTARRVPANMRAAAELLGQVFSLQIQTVEGMEAYVAMRAARALLDRIVAEFPIDGELIENLESRLEQLASFIPCEGAGVLVEGMWRASRSAPTVEEAKGLANFCNANCNTGIFASHQLCKDYPGARDWRCKACGVLAIPLSVARTDWLFFFRHELPHVVAWAGDPDKTVVSRSDGTGLSPRTSFAAWKEQVRGQSAPWTARQRLIGETLRVYLLEIILRFSEIIHEERRQAELRQRLMASQLNHRVKGTLKLIQSLVHLGFDGDPHVRDFVRTLEGRIKALALAHDATSTANGNQIRHLMETAIALHASYQTPIRLNGPDIGLDPKAYCVLALVIHELCTGSALSGALSQQGANLDVHWQHREGQGLMIVWEERLTHPAALLDDDGLRLHIIKRNIPHAIGGTAELEIENDSLTAIFLIPDRFVEVPNQIASQPIRQRYLSQPSRELADSTILVVENHLPSAIEAERLLYEHGAARVSVAGNVAAALEMVARAAPDVALLDIDLGDETSFEIADQLDAANIPFVFAGKEPETALIPQRHLGVAILPKPYTVDLLVTTLHDALLPSLIRTVLTKLL
jgi:light-regulated signal transduction histidine kinase (bacteriophytochrome)/CheY-like chemotaxis protein